MDYDMLLQLDRECEYNGVTYRIVEILRSGNLLVIPKDQYDNNEFPITPLIIPGE